MPQKLRFLVAGAFNTGVGYVLFSGMFLLFGRWVHYLLIGLVAHFIAVVNAFLVHRLWVFHSTERWQRSFVRFNLSQLVSLGFGMSALYVLVEFVRWNPLIAQAAVTVVSVTLNYLLHRYYSFRDPQGAAWGAKMPAAARSPSADAAPSADRASQG
jgi:putative flippase GtrA